MLLLLLVLLLLLMLLLLLVLFGVLFGRQLLLLRRELPLEQLDRVL